MQKETTLLILPAIEKSSEIIKGIKVPVTLTKGSFLSLEYKFENGKFQLLHKGKDIKEFSFVWLSSFWSSRDLAYAVKIYLEHFKTPHTYVEQTTSKISDQMNFAICNIKTPNTFYIERCDITHHIETIEEVCGYPLIIKDVKGSRGKFSALCKNREELLKKLADLPAKRKYLFQTYIPNEYDWGVLVANGVVVSAEKSYHKFGGFRNNSCNGSKEVFIKFEDIPEIIKDMALKSSKQLKLDWSRADIVIDMKTEIPYLLEVNRFPGITTKTTEVSGAQSFINSILNTL